MAEHADTTSADGSVAVWDPFSSEVHDDPYPFYHRLRSEDPVHYDDAGAWLLTRYEDALTVLRDPHLSSDHTRSANWRRSTPIGEVMRMVMLFRDPPDHTRLRTLVNKAFTPRVAEGLRTRIQQVVDELVDQVQHSGKMDVIGELAYPLPVIVICELLGIPPEDRDRFRGWSRTLAGTIDPMPTPDAWDEAMVRTAPAALELGEYFRNLITARRRTPGDDLLSALIAAEEQGDRLSEQELLVMCGLLLIAGHETTMNLIGNGTLALLRNRDQFERLRADPSLIRSAVEELLRFDSPVQLTARTLLQDLEIGGKQIRARQQVVVLIGAANRDPERFPDPDRLDLGREDNHHIAFGAGHHFCLGAPLARVEGQIAISTLARRMPGLELATDKPEWRETVTLRGLNALPVTF